MQLFSDDQWLYEDTTLTGLDRPGADLAAMIYGCIVRGSSAGHPSTLGLKSARSWTAT